MDDFRSEEKLRIVLSVLRGEAGVAEMARGERCSETPIAKWRDLLLEAGARALADGGSDRR
jgi:transposase-like protein